MAEGVEVAEKVLRAVRAGAVGPGDSIEALLTAARTIYAALSQLSSREDSILMLKDSLAYLPAGSAYSGALATLSIVLGDFAEELSRDPRMAYLSPRDIGQCIYHGVTAYASEALARLYDYCKEASSGTVMVVPRGSLALTCAVAASHAGARVVIPYTSDGEDEEAEARDAFRLIRAERVPWYFAYQLIPDTVRLVSQAELVSPSWAVVTRGTRELILEFTAAKGSVQGVDILSLLASLVTSGEMPDERKLPLQRITTPWQVDVEIPVLEVLRLRRAGVGVLRAVVTEMGSVSLSRPRVIAVRRNTLRALHGVIAKRCER